MPKPKQTLLIIDSNSLMHRSFHALPPLSTKDGTIVNAVYGFLTTFLKAVKEFSPTYVAAVFDVPGGTFRHKKYKAYKATREKAAQELYDQFPIMHDVLQTMQVPIFEKKDFEADDVIGTLVEKHHDQVQAIILTADMDELQLVQPNVRVYRLRKGVTDIVLFDEKAVKEMYGITPKQVVDYKALRGDPSDNIPGVKGIGEKTAKDLLGEFKTLETLYKAVEKNDKRIRPKVLELLKTHKDDAFMSQDLARIVLDVPISAELVETEWKPYDQAKVRDLFSKLEFTTLLARLPKQEHELEKATPLPAEMPKQKPHTDGQYELIATEDDFVRFFSRLELERAFAFDTETTSTDPWRANLLGISFCFAAKQAYYLNIAANPKWLQTLKSIFENEAIHKYGHNIKYDVEMLKTVGIEVQGATFDTMIAAYLTRPGIRQYSLDAVAFKELGVTMQPIEELIGKGKNEISMADVPVEKVSWYSCEDVDMTFRLVEIFRNQLEEQGLTKLFHEIEMPLVPVLARVEEAGVNIDDKLLSIMSKSMKKKIAELEKKIHAAAGKAFNINSPLQLKEILFDVLHISTEGLQKTKTGISTAASELEKLIGTHPIIESIMEYREIAKLQSTYILALPLLINPKTHRLHTSYNQTIAATGRLSSSDPNLQNIPTRTDLGNEIRKAFVARPGCKLVSADYSQVELRIIASLAKDEKMIDAFKRGEDIHRVTAAYIFDVPPEDITPDQRDAAKEVNFGVLYGMGAYGLASRKKISREKARGFIEKYFTVYDQVYQFLEDTRVKAQDQGYVETVMGRKRYLPEIYSSMRQVRAQAERMAVNFPIQGSAADFMKLAMIAVHHALPTVSPGSKMILQVHDELVFEVPEKDVTIVSAFAKKSMEGVAHLEVPLVVDVSVGENWGAMEKASPK